MAAWLRNAASLRAASSAGVEPPPVGAGAGARTANAIPMPERNNEPVVTAHDLRAALAPRRTPRRPTTLLSEAPGEWDWDPGVSNAERAELAELRETAARQSEQLDELRRARDSATTQARALREALDSLASARAWKRRAAVKAVRARGLLDTPPAEPPSDQPAP